MKNIEIDTSKKYTLFVVYKIDKGLFCTDSKDISSIIRLPAYQTLSDTKPFVTGIFTHRDSVIEMYDLRSAFHLPTLNQAYEDFVQMLDDRKQDHINWVTELERTLGTGEKFTLATDPHKCAFGKWYNQYPFGDDEASHHLKKIEEPHRLLHLAADETAKCTQNCGACTREECLKTILKRIKEECMPKILRLLDETKEIFLSTVYHEMVLLLEGTSLGIVVDEILAVGELDDMRGQNVLRSFQASPLISNVKKSNQWPELILELDFSVLHSSSPGILAESGSPATLAYYP